MPARRAIDLAKWFVQIPRMIEKRRLSSRISPGKTPKIQDVQALIQTWGRKSDRFRGVSNDIDSIPFRKFGLAEFERPAQLLKQLLYGCGAEASHDNDSRNRVNFKVPV